MADEIDLAADLIDHELRQALKMLKLRQQDIHNQTVQTISEYCIDCGDEIRPLARKELGYQNCLDCAETAERQGKMFADKG